LWIPFVTCSVLAALSVTARAQEEGEEAEEEVIAATHRLAKERRDAGIEKREELARSRKAKLKAFKNELDDKMKNAEKLGKLFDVQSNDVRLPEIKEPGTPEDVVEGRPIKDWVDPTGSMPLTRHPIWSLRPEDFRFWRPVRVNIERPLLARGAYEKTDLVPQTKRVVFRDVFLAVPFALTNSTDRKLMICPRMWIVSENLRFTPETGGFIVQEDVERSMFRELVSTSDLIGYIKNHPEGLPTQTFEPGKTHYGVAVFPLPDPELDRMTLVVEGLNNASRYDRRLKRVLAIEFEHPGDEFHPLRESIELRGKGWQWMWMWYEELQVSPLEKFEFKTPTDARQKVMWAYQMTLTNKSRDPQKLDIRRVNTILKVKLTSFGVTADVEFTDDGKSTIHKARVMEEMAQPFKGERFFSGTLAPDDVKVFPVIFDEDDIVWDKVYEQVESGLMWDEEKQRGISIGYGEEPLKPKLESFTPDRETLANVKIVTLTPEQKTQVRKEVLEALPEVIAAERKDWMLRADVTAVSGMASGTFRIRRSYFKKGVIEQDWIHKWEE
ncbi:MAG: hypothetical protein ACYSU0_18015, partial [Planctomycetota bacterium]